MNQKEPSFSVALVDRRDPLRTTLHHVRDLRRYFVGDDQGGKVKLLHPRDPELQQTFIERLDQWLDCAGSLVIYWKYQLSEYYYVIVLDMNAE